MIDHGYQRTNSDHCVFVKRFDDGEFIILLLYVDDMLIVGKNSEKISKLKNEMKKYFSMKDLGPPKHILGMSIHHDRTKHKLWLSQEKYIEKVLERFYMESTKPTASHFCLSSKQSPTTDIENQEMNKVPYASTVGSLMYAMVCTGAGMTNVVGVVSRFLSNPGNEHLDAVKWILRYLKETSKTSLCFGSRKPKLIGYTYANMAREIDYRKSTYGFLITYLGRAESWQSKL